MATIKNCAKRLVVEDGIIISKVFKKSSDEWQNSKGEKVGAQPERWSITVASSYEKTEEFGFSDVSIIEFPVEKQLFNLCSFLAPVRVKFEVTPYGNRADSIELLKMVK